MSRSREKKSAPRKRAAAAGARSGPGDRPKAPPRPSRSTEPGTASPTEPNVRPVRTRLVRMPLVVRWRDLDAFNHVNNASYLTYLEETRLNWLQSLPGSWMSADSAPVLAAVQLNYRRPIEWPQALAVELSVERLGESSLTLGHRIVADDAGGALFCDGHSVLVWIDRQGGKATALPAAVRAACS